MLKRVAKALVPAAAVPAARRMYRWLAGRAPTFRRSYSGMDALPALKCEIAYNRYGGYCVPASSSHRPAARAVLSGKVHEPDTIEYMTSHCGARDIVHAGTFFGDFLPGLSRALGSGSLIWAFEPNLENYRCARITLELNESKNVRLAHAGLGAKRQVLCVQTSDAKGGSLGGASRIVPADKAMPGMETVEIVTIDDVIPPDRQVGILQLDVEGYEEEALRGALQTIGRCLPILILEALPGSNLARSAWFGRNVLDRGYAQVARIHGNLVYRCTADPAGSAN